MNVDTTLEIFSGNGNKHYKFVSQSRTGLQIYDGHDDQLNRLGPT
jgi:hypothetical protein